MMSDKNTPSGRERVIDSQIIKEGIIDIPTGAKIGQNDEILREGIFDLPTGCTLDKDGRVVQGIFNMTTGYKINKNGQIVKEGIVDIPLGYKVNEGGQLVKEGILDMPTGVKFKKSLEQPTLQKEEIQANNYNTEPSFIFKFLRKAGIEGVCWIIFLIGVLFQAGGLIGLGATGIFLCHLFRQFRKRR